MHDSLKTLLKLASDAVGSPEYTLQEKAGLALELAILNRVILVALEDLKIDIRTEAEALAVESEANIQGVDDLGTPLGAVRVKFPPPTWKIKKKAPLERLRARVRSYDSIFETRETTELREDWEKTLASLSKEEQDSVFGVLERIETTRRVGLYPEEDGLLKELLDAYRDPEEDNDDNGDR